VVNWVSYKTVRVEARAVVHRGEDAAAVKARGLRGYTKVSIPFPQFRMEPNGRSASRFVYRTSSTSCLESRE